MAATTPPALNSIQKKASFDGFVMPYLKSPQHQPTYKCRHNDPRNVARSRDQQVRNTFSPQANGHCAGRKVEPRYRMEDDKQHADKVEHDEQRIAHALLEMRIGLGPVAQRAQHEESLDDKHRDEDTAELAQNEFQVVPLAQPPIHRHVWPVPARMKRRVARRSLGRSLIHCGHPKYPVLSASRTT